jgi:hypothetical protein
MKINDQSLRDFLQFWKIIPHPADLKPGDRPDEFADGWIKAQRAPIAKLPSDRLDQFTSEWRRQFEANDAAQASAESRANSLLVVVGLLGGFGAVASGSLLGAWIGWVALFLVSGTVLIYSAVATAWLAMRVGEVRRWDAIDLDPDELAASKSAGIEEAHQFYVAARRNRHIVAISVGYLRDAQKYALSTVVSLAAIAIVTTMVVVTKPAAEPTQVQVVSLPSSTATAPMQATPRASTSLASQAPASPQPTTASPLPSHS